jgi:myo-inositol-1(or 4)-monophosphatase
VGSIAAEFRRPAKAAAGLGESTWDVMAALPILQGLGIENTIDWKRTDLSSKLRFVCGSPDLLAVFEPLMKGRGSAAGSVASA